MDVKHHVYLLTDLEVTDLEVTQTWTSSANDDLLAETITFLNLILCCMGSQRSCLTRGLASAALRDSKMSLAAEFWTCWSGLMT